MIEALDPLICHSLTFLSFICIFLIFRHLLTFSLSPFPEAFAGFLLPPNSPKSHRSFHAAFHLSP